MFKKYAFSETLTLHDKDTMSEEFFNRLVFEISVFPKW